MNGILIIIFLAATYGLIELYIKTRIQNRINNQTVKQSTSPNYAILEPQIEYSQYETTIDYPEYQKYLLSNEWKLRVALRLDMDKYRCQYCCSEVVTMDGSSHIPNVHHLHYRNLKKENVKRDLITLCKSCHLDLHSKYSLSDMEFHINNKRMQNQQ